MTQPHSDFFLQQDDAEESPSAVLAATPSRWGSCNFWSAAAWWRERKGDVAKGRQARYRRNIADSETRHPPGNRGQRSFAMFRDGFRWQLIGTERNKEARHERISDRDLDHRCSCRRRARRLAGQRGAGGAQAVPGTRARGTAPRDSPGRNARRRPAAAWHRDATSRWPLGGPCQGTRFTRARKTPADAESRDA